MVTKMTVPKSIKRALNYNEQKVQQGQAECLYANEFLKEADQMTFYEKLEHFEQRNALNQRATTNTLHISLNFDPSEKLTNEQLIEIAKLYMDKIGFGDQPYIVYRHDDAGHEHIHVVTTTIKKDGKRISLHNIGRNQSTQARKEIEKLYGLVRAEDKGKKQAEAIEKAPAQKVRYGKSETKRAITNVLDKVLTEYKFSSLVELNAVLELYNVRAERGKVDSAMYRNGGLYYRVLDENGKPVGVPIKASSIYSQPTLNNLEKRFEENEKLKQIDKKQLKTKIDWIMHHPPTNMQAFKEALKKERITLVIRQNEEGRIYGLTYVDHNTKSVFNGSDIGKEYSARAMQEKLARTRLDAQTTTQAEKQESKSIEKREENQQEPTLKLPAEKQQSITPDNDSKLMEKLMQSEFSGGQVPHQFRKRKKKRKQQ